ncbi:YncE family protein [Mycobacterium sp. OTB74]|uniref:YncE family protein n=1 Tax=Mycobacterium sp. OTB74 TaxID=1853452 RepID=UPI0024748BBB|nr:YncE family protein [Mycobacterium sp. OTB74]
MTASPLEAFGNSLADAFLSFTGLNPADPQPNPSSFFYVFQLLSLAVAREVENVFDPAPPAGTPIVGTADPNTGTVTGSAVFGTDPSADLTYTADPTSAGGGTVTFNPTTLAFTYTPNAIAKLSAIATGTDSFTVTVHDGLSTTAETITVPVSPPTIVATVITGYGPAGIAVAPNGKTVYVSNFSSGTVTPIDTTTNTAGTPITVGVSGLEGVVITPNGSTLYVASEQSGTVTPIDTTTNTAGTPITVGGAPFYLTVTPNGKTVYVESGAVTPIDTTTNTASTPITIGGSLFGLAVTPNGSTVYVSNGISTVTPIDTTTNTPGTPITVGLGPASGLVVTPDGKTLYVANFNSGTVSVISTATNTVVDTIGLGPGTDPQAAAVSPDGSLVYVVNDGTGTVSAISTATNTVVGTIPLGTLTQPQAVAVSTDGSHIYVALGDDRVLVVAV